MEQARPGQDARVRSLLCPVLPSVLALSQNSHPSWAALCIKQRAESFLEF